MQRTVPSLWLALTLGVFAAGCSKNAAAPTDPAMSADRGRDDDDRRDDGDDDDRPLTYAVIGDVPYGQAALDAFPSLIAGINQDADVKRVIHVGDIKSGSTVCSDAWFQSISTQFATFADPLVYAIGDNEWTDCHRKNNGGYNPLERLARVREVFFPRPGYTLGGRPKRIKAQDGYPENQRWQAAEVVFSTFHVIGSNNGRAPWFGDRPAPNTGETAAETAAREAEYLARNAANIGWLERTFQQAKEDRARGVVLFFQADLLHPEDRAAGASFTAHVQFLTRLAELAADFRRPVLLVSGDSHDLRVDVGVPWFSTYYGLTAPANVTQIVVDRSIEDDKNWLKLRVDPRTTGVFSWSEVTVP